MRAKGIAVTMTIGVTLTAAGASAQSCGWRWANPNPPRVNLRAAAVASGRIVAVGDGGLVLHSGDGRAWTISQAGVTADLVAMARGAGQFVAVGDDVIASSPDGVAWVVMDHTGLDLTDVAYGASWFVAVARTGLDGHVLRSGNGVAWEPVAAPWAGSARAVGADGDGIVVLAGDDVWRTGDTVTWESIGTLPETAFPYAGENPLARDDVLVDGATVLISRGSDLYRSQDGGEPASVLNVALGCERFSSFVTLWADGNRLVASGFEACPPLLDPTAVIFVSTDEGATWQLAMSESGGGFPAMARSGATAVALGARGDLLVGPTVTSWECAGSGCTSGACEDSLLDVVLSGEGLVAIGGVGQCNRVSKRLAGGTRAVSTAGLVWTVAPLDDVARLHDLAVHDDLLASVGDSWIGRSTDQGATWEEATVPSLPKMHSVAWAEDRFAAVGVGGLLLTSDDALTWATVFTPTEADLYRVEAFDDRTWILGRDATVLSSSDLLFWDPVDVPTTGSLHGIAHPEWGWVIVGDDGIILTSADGQTWGTPYTGIDATVDLRDAVASASVVVAVGGVETGEPGVSQGLVVASRDGATWTRWSVRGGMLETAIRAGDGIVAVGADRSLLWSPCVADLVEFESAEIDVRVGTTESLEVGIGRPAPGALRITLSATPAGAIELPTEVVLAAGQHAVSVPVKGVMPGALAVVTVTLPNDIGGGAADALVRVRASTAVRRAGRRLGP